MTMTTTVQLRFEGAAACRDCQRDGIGVCAHIGFNEEAWIGLPGRLVLVPGLDSAFEHTLRAVDISADRKTVTLTVETARPALLDLARHLSTLGGPKAMVRAVTAAGEVLVQGAYDAPLQDGQQVWINGVTHVVTAVDHPNRHPVHGTVAEGLDWQVATVEPVPQPDPVTPAGRV